LQYQQYCAEIMFHLLLACAEEKYVAGWHWVRPRLVLAAPLTPEATASAVLLRLADRDGHTHAAFGL
jgi:hypothetical protein